MANLSAAISALTRMRQGTTAISVVRPNLAAPSSVTSSSAWAYGSWVQYASSGDLVAHALIGLSIDRQTAGNAGTDYQLDVGSGAVGAEAVRATFAFDFDVSSLNGHMFACPVPVQIPAGERVALRIAAASSSVVFGFKLFFMPRPF